MLTSGALRAGKVAELRVPYTLIQHTSVYAYFSSQW